MCDKKKIFAGRFTFTLTRLDYFHHLSARPSAARVQKSSRSPLHRAAAIHFIHFNEAAVINRSVAIITIL